MQGLFVDVERLEEIGTNLNYSKITILIWELNIFSKARNF